MYSGYKLKFLVEKGGAQINEIVRQKHFTQDDEFSAAQGFMIAVEMSPPVQPEVATLEFWIKEEDFTDPDTNKHKIIDKQLKTHICTAQELGKEEGDGSRAHLFP